MMLRMALPLDQMFFSDFKKKYLKQETDALMFQFLLSALIFHHRFEKSGANLLNNYDATLTLIQTGGLPIMNLAFFPSAA